MHLALVASNGLAATFCKQCKIWDIAAGVLLVTEAGGVATDPFGADRSRFDLAADPERDASVLAAGPRVHDRLLASIAQCDPELRPTDDTPRSQP
jgi:fructose-1,6-bisphosphatase/inositol monophosphatase family enzyme